MQHRPHKSPIEGGLGSSDASFCLCQASQLHELGLSPQTVSSDCLFKLSLQTVSSNCLFKLSPQTVSSDCLLKLSLQNLSSDCLLKLSLQTVSSDCLFRLSLQTVSSNCLSICLRCLFFNASTTRRTSGQGTARAHYRCEGRSKRESLFAGRHEAVFSSRYTRMLGKLKGKGASKK